MNPRNLEATPILDYDNPIVRQFGDSIDADDQSDLGFLRAAHASISRRVRPIYTIRESQPVSRTLSLGAGSCSQRVACLEALARFNGIGTRVQALWISGNFWNKRFQLTRFFIPKQILLAWPQFYIDPNWIGLEEIYGRIEDLAKNSQAFSNDSETLFEAIGQTAVDFKGRTRQCASNCDLSGFVQKAGEFFDSRDDLLKALGSLENTCRGKAFEALYSGRASA